MNTASTGHARWPDSLLAPMRGIGDPPADSAIAQISSSGELQAVNDMMRALVVNDGIIPESLPAAVRDYLAASGQLPAWADPARIQAGERVFWRYGPAIVSILNCYSLPYCYAGRKGVQVLALTARLYTNATRRIIETAQMVIDVMRPGGLGAQGTGIRTAQKVRLMHAGVRFQIGSYKGWNPDWGTPVNQTDIAGTLMSFSWVTLDGLRRLGFHLTADEEESYLHSWNVVGHILGLRPEMLPANMTEAESLARRIQETEYGACPEGKEMTAALVQMMQYYLPGALFDPVPAALIRYFMGDYADLLGVGRPTIEEAVFAPLHVVNAIASVNIHAAEPIARLHEIFSRKLIEGLIFAGRGGKRIPFTIPTELRQAWGVNWTA